MLHKHQMEGNGREVRKAGAMFWTMCRSVSARHFIMICLQRSWIVKGDAFSIPSLLTCVSVLTRDVSFPSEIEASASKVKMWLKAALSI